MNPFTEVIVSIATAVTAVGTAWNTWNIRRVEKNTNSIKDALVATTKKSSYAEGKLAGNKQRKSRSK